ncbi:MAG: hypothetical protein LBI77_02465 [Puniceicoccales bacterium]|jgi:hypothetical protein|nr:hypothetical protein [Puniceicoccales bacterium]
MKDGEYSLLMIGLAKGVNGGIGLVANGRGFDGSERSFVNGADGRGFGIGVALPGRVFTADGEGFDDKKTFLGAKARNFAFFLAFFERRNFFVHHLFLDLRDFFISRLFFDLRDFFVCHLFFDLRDFFISRLFLDLRDFFICHLFLDLRDFFVLRSFFNRSGFFRSKACFLWDFLLIFLGPE